MCAADRPGPGAFEPALEFSSVLTIVVLSSSAKPDRIKDVPTFVSSHARTRQHQSDFRIASAGLAALHFGLSHPPPGVGPLLAALSDQR